MRGGLNTWEEGVLLNTWEEGVLLDTWEEGALIHGRRGGFGRASYSASRAAHHLEFPTSSVHSASHIIFYCPTIPNIHPPLHFEKHSAHAG